jgi:phospholipid/cholesterol/gamma-HCH transport system substrate-binding protein
MDRSVEVRVGVVVLVAIIALVAGLLWLTQTQIRDRGYTIGVVFPGAGGLAEGDPVHVGGVQRGRVQDVALRANDVLVTLWLQSETPIRRDARIAIADQGLMGQKFVNVSLGTSAEVIQPDEIVAGRPSVGVVEAMDELTAVLTDVKRIVGDFSTVLADTSNRALVRRTVSNTHDLVIELNALAKETRPGIRSAVQDFSASARDLRELTDSRGETLGRTIDRAESAVTELDSTIASLKAISRSLHAVAARVDSGQGTLGQLVEDEKLYLDMRKTMKDLDALILDFQANPRKYIKFSVF